jgi:hypothetical protein
MKRLVFIVCLLCGAAAASAELKAQAQVPSPTPSTVKLAWEHDGINTDRYELIVDGGAPTNLGKLQPVTGSTYEAPFPALTPGTHVLLLQACNIAGCSASAPLSVSVVVVPTAPQSLRIKVGS